MASIFEPARYANSIGNRIIVVDDESNARRALAEILIDEDYVVETAANGLEALEIAKNFNPHVVLTDLRIPLLDGLELLCRLRDDVDDPIGVILMTADADVRTAVNAMREGAVDYLVKPLCTSDLLEVVKRAMDGAKLQREAKIRGLALRDDQPFASIVGTTTEMAQILNAAVRLAALNAPVLIIGEAGTGKAQLAAALHRCSARRSGPFVRLYNEGRSESSSDSELFGIDTVGCQHSHAVRRARFDQADDGTLFVDEVGNLGSDSQAKLLNELRLRRGRRDSDRRALRADVRVIAATNCDLKARVLAGTFSADLCNQLSVLKVKLPALRARTGDIPALVTHFRLLYGGIYGRRVTQVSDHALRLLVEYPWPGNVRELKSVIERAVVLADDGTIDVSHLPSEISRGTLADATPRVPGATMAELERYAILKTLESVGGLTGKAAEALDISPRKIQYRLQQYLSAPKSQVPAVNGSSEQGESRSAR